MARGLDSASRFARMEDIDHRSMVPWAGITVLTSALTSAFCVFQPWTSANLLHGQASSFFVMRGLLLHAGAISTSEDSVLHQRCFKTRAKPWHS